MVVFVQPGPSLPLLDHLADRWFSALSGPSAERAYRLQADPSLRLVAWLYSGRADPAATSTGKNSGKSSILPR